MTPHTPRGHFAPSAIVDGTAIFADTETRVWHFALVLQQCRIGRSCSIGSRAEIGRASRIGDFTRISAGVFLPPRSEVGSRTFIGPNVTCTDDMYPVVPRPDDPPYDAQPPVIGNAVSIGAGAILLPGVRIGDYARIAAGAVVTKDVAPHETVRSAIAARTIDTPERWAARPEWFGDQPKPQHELRS